MKIIPTILCGGAGSRLWPLSRMDAPKPFFKLVNGVSLLQQTFLRAANLRSVREVITVAQKEIFFNIQQELAEIKDLLPTQVNKNFILEPFGRDTAPAIAQAAFYAANKFGGNVILLILPSDHIITKNDNFEKALTRACELAVQGKIVAFGTKATSPETGYGYIEANGNEILNFVEKPSLEKAKKYIESKSFYWNTGIFCFTADSLLNELKIHRPKLFDQCQKCVNEASEKSEEETCQIEIAATGFGSVKKESIDYAVMENSSKTAVVHTDMGWSDVGNWRAISDLKTTDGNGNNIDASSVILDVENCYIRSDTRLVAAIGLKDLSIVDTEDALLIVDKNRTQDVKTIYEKLVEENQEVYKHHKTVRRPWGSYTVIQEYENCKVKKLLVKPGQKLSIQSHQHRSENWVVVKGKALVLKGDEEIDLTVSQSIIIPKYTKHRLSNIGTDDLEVIEIQTGEYFGEDDIIRYEDDYGRI